jgi:hypothetical protein
MKRNWISSLLALGCAATMSGGCGTVLRQIVERNTPPANINAPRASDAQKVARTPMAGLTPLPSGSGLIVFEPLASEASDDGAKAFASGCGRWLHLHASGQGALGKTPFWGSPEDARRALGLPSLALDAKAARSVAAATGATHFAVGKMEKRGASSTLSLRVHDTSTMQVLGAPVVASGSRAQIVQSLPRLAREIDSRLGVAPIIPTRCELSAAEVEAVGRVLWKPIYNKSTPPEQIAALQVLAPRSPLAGLLWMRHGSLSGAQWSTIIAQQINLAPSNTLVLATRRGSTS